MKDSHREGFSGFDRESVGALWREWRELLSRLAEEAEDFTRERPRAGLLAAFFAGAFLSSIFRRRG
jgi:hypothetical protein